MLTILEGSTFCICDDRGDIAAETSGFFAHDTRFLSRLVLRVGGARAAPPLVRAGSSTSSAAFYLRNADRERLPRDALSIARQRFVGRGCRSGSPCGTRAWSGSSSCWLSRLAADFADIISVKLHDFALGDPEHAQPLPPPAPARLRRGAEPDLDRRSARGSQHAARDLEAGSFRRRTRWHSRSPSSRTSVGSQGRRAAVRWSEAISNVEGQLDEERETRRRRRRCLDAARPAGARRLGEPAAFVRPLDRRPRGPAHADRRVPATALRRRDAVVHDRVRA